MDVKRALVQRLLLSASTDMEGMEESGDEHFNEMGSPSFDRYSQMSRDQISSLMCEAFTARDSRRWAQLCEHLDDKRDTLELQTQNLATSILHTIVRLRLETGDSAPLKECTNLEAIASGAYDLAALVLASWPVLERPGAQ